MSQSQSDSRSIPPHPGGDEYFERYENAAEAKEQVREREEQFEQEAKRTEHEQALSVAEQQSTQDWLEAETSRETDVIAFRGREFRWKQPGILHRKTMLELAKEFGPEAQDIDPNNDEEIDEVLEETFDEEGISTVLELYDHVLRSLCDLCVDDTMGDMSQPDDADLPLGAMRWGQFPEDDHDGQIGLATLFDQVVMQRFADEDEEPIDTEDAEAVGEFPDG